MALALAQCGLLVDKEAREMEEVVVADEPRGVVVVGQGERGGKLPVPFSASSQGGSTTPAQELRQSPRVGHRIAFAAGFMLLEDMGGTRISGSMQLMVYSARQSFMLRHGQVHALLHSRVPSALSKSSPALRRRAQPRHLRSVVPSPTAFRIRFQCGARAAFYASCRRARQSTRRDSGALLYINVSGGISAHAKSPLT